MKTSVTLSLLATLGAASAQSTTGTATTCPAPGTTDAAGDVSCDPAVPVPGQACVLLGDCYFLRGLGLNTSLEPATATSSEASSETTTETIVDSSSNSETESPTTTVTASVTVTGTGTETSSAMPTMTGCPAPGTTTEDGYSCNPAHQYPPGEVCVLIGDCYFLRGLGLNTSMGGGNGTATGTSPPYPTGTTVNGCPAPGTTTEDGYSCNPAHQYPEGELCVLIGDCYFLRGTGLLTSGAPIPPIVTGTGAPMPPMPTSTDHVVISGAGLLKTAPLTAVAGLLAVVAYAML